MDLPNLKIESARLAICNICGGIGPFGSVPRQWQWFLPAEAATGCPPIMMIAVVASPPIYGRFARGQTRGCNSKIAPVGQLEPLNASFNSRSAAGGGLLRKILFLTEKIRFICVINVVVWRG